MKKFYEVPTAEVLKLLSEDIMSLSAEIDDTADAGDYY